MDTQQFSLCNSKYSWRVFVESGYCWVRNNRGILYQDQCLVSRGKIYGNDICIYVSTHKVTNKTVHE